MNLVNKKILWISDFDLTEAPGGAQRSDKILIDKGTFLQASIKNVTAKEIAGSNEYSNFLSSLENYDLVVSSNISYIYSLHPSIIQTLHNHKNHVRIEHDSNLYLTPEERHKLFGNCKKSFFLSQFHLDFFKEDYGLDLHTAEIIQDPIDPDVFKDKKEEREDSVLYSGYLHELKGADNFFNCVMSSPDVNFVVAGWPASNIYYLLCEKLSNISFLKHVDYENMPEIYNRYSKLFYDPICKEPFCRTVAEANMCGMQIITSEKGRDRIGCLQEIHRLGRENFIESCRSASERFWQKVSEVL